MMRANEAPTESGSVRLRTLEILQQVTGDADVLTDPDLQLYGSGLLDSLATVSLIVAFEDAFGLVISPAEFDRDAWATPPLLVADIERRLAEGAAA
jgi:D-alanine--poly(phosphoribitol) ligase subunit 2